MGKKRIAAIFKNIFVWILSLMMLIPFVVVLVNSFKTREAALSLSLTLPETFQWQNYLTVIQEGKLIQSFFNSMLYAGVTVILGVVLSAMAAFVLNRNKTKINKFLYFFIILGITLPINHISLMKILQLLNLYNTRTGLSLIYTAWKIPFSVFIIYGFVSTIPRELDEAAVIDGCGSLSLFFRVIAPVLKPVLVTVGVLNFMDAWNQFIMPLYYINDTAKWPMTLAVYNFFGRYEMSWNLVCADVVLTSLPIIVVYLFGQRHIISGMLAGSVKG